MLREIGIALIEVQQPSQLIYTRLHEIAAQYTTETVRVVVLPTVLLVQVGTVGYEVDTTRTSMLQLDMAGRVDDIATLAAAGAITPADAIAAVEQARYRKPRFGPLTTIAGYGITTVGFGMIRNPTWASLPAYLFLGLVVGAILVMGRRLPSLRPVLPTLSAMAVTMLATWFVADVANDGLLRVISPALVGALPGMLLTTGAMELAGAHIVSGSSRLVYGATRLALLVFGVALGVHVAGKVPPQDSSAQLGPWSFYVAIIVVAIGVYVYLSAPEGSFIWLVLSIGVALISQAIAGHFLPVVYSGFIGAFVSVPFAILAARIKTSPPAIVMMLVAFWALVPGALSFESVSQAATGGNINLASLETIGSAIMSIALGTLVGWSVFYRDDER